MVPAGRPFPPLNTPVIFVELVTPAQRDLRFSHLVTRVTMACDPSYPCCLLSVKERHGGRPVLHRTLRGDCRGAFFLFRSLFWSGQQAQIPAPWPQPGSPLGPVPHEPGLFALALMDRVFCRDYSLAA